MEPDWTLDVRIAPERALARLSGAINRRKKRLFGLFKIENEYVGVVKDDRFEIWERNQRAVHAVGRVRARRNGSRIEVRFAIPPPTRVLIAVFFALYGLVATGLAIRSEALPADKVLVAFGGALSLMVIFTVSAMRQRANIRSFVERLFGDLR
jgi:hypothetical protein